MKERDLKIQKGIERFELELTNLKQINDVEYKPHTNLIISTKHPLKDLHNLNLRNLNVEELCNIFSIYIETPVKSRGLLVVLPHDTIGFYNDIKVCGYTYKEWLEDFRYLIIKCELKDKINVLNDKIFKLREYYSEDKIIDDEIDALLK